MSHHDGIHDKYMQELVRNFRLGATGEFPLGKLTASDEGELRIAIGEEKGKVVIHFGKEVAWIGFTPDQARELATSLVAHADNIMAIGG